MSDAYEKALEAVHKENEKRIGRLDIRTVVEIYLAALPPSIVVDGRVVELSNGFAWHKWAMDAVAGVFNTDMSGGVRMRRLFDAAREVADE